MHSPLQSVNNSADPIIKSHSFCRPPYKVSLILQSPLQSLTLSADPIKSLINSAGPLYKVSLFLQTPLQSLTNPAKSHYICSPLPKLSQLVNHLCAFLIVVLPCMLTITQLLLQQNAHFYY
jgi:hypothetical protein